jgi:hypothetical protein
VDGCLWAGGPAGTTAGTGLREGLHCAGEEDMEGAPGSRKKSKERRIGDEKRGLLLAGGRVRACEGGAGRKVEAMTAGAQGRKVREFLPSKTNILGFFFWFSATGFCLSAGSRPSPTVVYTYTTAAHSSEDRGSKGPSNEGAEPRESCARDLFGPPCCLAGTWGRSDAAVLVWESVFRAKDENS